MGCVILNEEGNTILAYSGPAGFCSINKAELLALKIGLQEAFNLHPHRLLVEGDSFCAIQWASQSSNPPWYLVDIIEEVIQLSGGVNISFHHIKRLANDDADISPKREFFK